MIASPKPSISVVIPVRNEAQKIGACIDGILDQTVGVMEIIVIDSGSTDGTLEILEKYEKVKVWPISPAEFNHGLTRNFGVEKAKGEYVILTVGDAVPANRFWVEELLRGFEESGTIAVCGRQVVPHELDKNPLEWYRPKSPPQRWSYQFSVNDFEKLTPEEKQGVCSWDDVTAMYERNELLRLPFRETSYCEDAIWAKEAIMAGHRIVYNSGALVYHYHNEDESFSFKRALTSLYYRRKLFGSTPTAQSFKQYLIFIGRCLKLVLSIKELSFRQKWEWLRYNMNQRRGVNRAIREFLNASNVGEKALDSLHEKWCGKPPIPLKGVV